MLKKKNKIVRSKNVKKLELQKNVKQILVENGYDEDSIKFDYKINTNRNDYEIDVVILSKKDEPKIILNVEHPSMYNENEDFQDNYILNLQSMKFDFQDKHLVCFDGENFHTINRLIFSNNNTYDFITDLTPNGISKLKNTSPEELLEKEKLEMGLSTPIPSNFINKGSLKDTGLSSYELYKMLLLKYIDEKENYGELFGRMGDIDKESYQEFVENSKKFSEYKDEDYSDLESCVKHFNSEFGKTWRYFSVSKTNPFELIKIISSLEFPRQGNSELSKEITEFISQIQKIQRNSTILLENLSFGTVFEHIFVISEKLECKIEEHNQYTTLFITNTNNNELEKIKFIFKVLGIPTKNIKNHISELKIETNLNYTISLQTTSIITPSSSNENYKNKFGNDLVKNNIIDLINTVNERTTMSFIIPSKILFEKGKGIEFRNELLKRTKIISIIRLPPRSITSSNFPLSLIMLEKGVSEISNYKIFMSYIEKIDIDFIFVKKNILKGFKEFRKNNLISSETDSEFLVNIDELVEDWTVSRKTPSEKIKIKSLKFTNPVNLKEVTEIIRPIKNVQFDKNQIIKISNMKNGVLEIENLEISKNQDKISENISSILEPGDILFSITGTLGKTAKIDRKITNLGISNNILIIRPIKSTIDSDYLKYVLDSENTKIQLITKSSAIPFLPINQVKNIQIELPTFEKQISIIKKIKDLNDKIIELKQQIQKYESQIEGTLLQKDE